MMTAASPHPTPLRARTQPSRPRVATILSWILLIQLSLPFEGTAAEPDGEMLPHRAIRIDGDNDFCDDEDGDGRVGIDDGIVNCDDSDGSAQRPYLIEGWTISMFDKAACLGRVSNSLPACQTAVNCGYENKPHQGFYLEGAVVVCRTTRHVVIRNVEVVRGSPLFSSERPDANFTACDDESTSGSPCLLTPAELVVWGSSNVVLQNLRVTTPQLAAFVASAVDVNGTRWPATNIRFLGVRLHAMSPDSGSTVAAALSAAGAPTGFTSRLVLIDNADVEIRDSELRAHGRQVAIHVDGDADRQRGTSHTFQLRNSTIEGALRAGVYVVGSRLQAYENQFRENGIAGNRVVALTDVSILVAAHMIIGSMEYEIRGNSFTMSRNGMTGISFETSSAGNVTRNRFVAVAGVVGGAAIMQWDGFPCNGRATYNDLNGFIVVNREPGCSVFAPRNWWGSDRGPMDVPPQTQGKILSDGWLRAPLDRLPTVRVLAPSPMADVYGPTVIEGESDDRGLGPVFRVEATFSQDDWRGALLANGTARWQLPIDVTLQPRGLLSLWVRACSATDCGPPARHDLRVVEPPDPPIALLVATPDSTTVGGHVRLDGSGSFSVQGFPIVAYRFTLGDGREIEWQPNHTAIATYEKPGKYTPTLQVQDVSGLVSFNFAQAIVRVTEHEADGNTALAPGVGSTFVVLSAAFVVWCGGRRLRQ